MQHFALLHAGEAAFVTSAAAFVRSGLSTDESVMVALPAAALAGLRSELARDGGDVEFVDMTSAGRNPGTVISAWMDFVQSARAAGRGMRGVGQCAWQGRTAAELDECHRHEALLNSAFEDGPEWSLMCPYDTAVLSPATIRGALATHPFVAADGDTWQPNPQYQLNWHSPLEGRLDDPPADAISVNFRLADLHKARSVARSLATASGLPPERRDDLAIAVSEVGTNSIVHGGGTGRLRAWFTGETVVCEIRDAGNISDPLVGRRRPSSTALGGRGLWIAHRLCDLVQVRSGTGGTVVRMSMSVN
jgi:anti-sigma regulatory factor (Ser/Thr protein kinase)